MKFSENNSLFIKYMFVSLFFTFMEIIFLQANYHFVKKNIKCE